MRIASFNVENLFERAVALNQDQWTSNQGENPSRWAAGRETLEIYSKLNALLRKQTYTPADQAQIIEYLIALGLEKSDESKLVILRRNRGSLVKRPRGAPLQVVAGGRDDWIGWLELKREAVDEVATQNTARVLKEVDADIVVVVEAEHRISLCRFNEQVLERIGGRPYDHVMLVDGNDERGIDVGLMTRSLAVIDSVRSHVDDRLGKESVFSRDCPEFHLRLASGEELVVLANHLKSKGYGTPAQSNAKREAQARRVREIYEGLRKTGHAHIVIAGDFNDTPDSGPLAPLLGEGSDLKDISAHPNFDDGGRPGTYANGTKSNKIDYILFSPALFERVTAGGIDRRGVWGGKNGTLWPHFPEMTQASQAASDHAAVWADLDL
ncbi:endonuclease/exonuclease/phosphatase [Methylobacterium sp. Leaf361]|uniref:endonuclease/exonuclease/phosphatase family protein n=1 Tax=Methylobacterium sp. Leaf361 TaxID=1736352 RepID=UPI0006F6B45F|nr:endonuclease/exonuclease/phosphatase family protein [Methylobacterium sp. Leaf361]KQS63534.1 endonuclease/exonuclease/phosphatase [Methylobacterium sp. Leaf361]